MYFNGVSNALGHRVRAVLISPGDKYYPFTARLNFDYMNNVAEYETCVLGLPYANRTEDQDFEGLR